MNARTLDGIDELYDQIAEIFTGKWRLVANCIDADTSIFYNIDDPSEAKSYCKTCPVKLECLDSVMQYPDESIRGEMTPIERFSLINHHRTHNMSYRYDLGLDA